MADDIIQTDAVLIDDDPLVHMTWKVKARRAGKVLAGFRSFGEFAAVSASFSRTVPIFVDDRLGAGETGLEVCARLVGLGFEPPVLATGHAPEEVPASPHVRRVQGKEPPW